MSLIVWILMLVMLIMYVGDCMMYKRNKELSEKAKSEGGFVVRPPDILERVYDAMFYLGAFLFFFWFFFSIHNTNSIPLGNFVFCSVFSGIGFAVNLYANWQTIVVSNDNVTVYRLFHRSVTLSVSDISVKFVLNEKSHILIYRNDKKLVCIRWVDTNSDDAPTMLKHRGF